MVAVLSLDPDAGIESEIKLEIRAPWLDSDVSKAFPIEELILDLQWGITEDKLRGLAKNVNGRMVYPTAVYIDNQIVNLLPDMTGSIRSDDPNGLTRSREFFNGPMSVLDLDKITGVAAYKVLPEKNPWVSAWVQASVESVVAA